MKHTRSAATTKAQSFPIPQAEFPDQKPETILLAVTGMSPAVLTETVWALAHPPQGQPPVLPHQVVVVTTSSGANQLQRELLDPRPDWQQRSVWETLRSALLTRRQPGSRRSPSKPSASIPGSDGLLQLCTPRVIEIPDARRGVKRPAADLRAAQDNEAAADFILEEVRRIVENPDTQLIASIAGGRKTMGALLYAAVSLLGRETDRVTHVLVNQPFDQCRGFFYPEQPVPHLPVATEPTPVRCRDARVELADIPFVPLRNLFERQLVRRPGGFRGLVARCQERVNNLTRGPLRLELSPHRTGLRLNDSDVPLSPLQHLLMLFLVQQRQAGEPPVEKYANAVPLLQSFGKAQFALCSPEDFSDWRRSVQVRDLDEQRLRKLLDELRAKLRRGGPETARLIPALPARGRFSLDLDPASIQLLP
jgi:CRISPR-associated protein (TIGR02584 family)